MKQYYRVQTHLLGLRLERGVLQRRVHVVLDESDSATETLLEARHVRTALPVLWLEHYQNNI